MKKSVLSAVNRMLYAMHLYSLRVFLYCFPRKTKTSNPLTHGFPRLFRKSGLASTTLLLFYIYLFGTHIYVKNDRDIAKHRKAIMSQIRC